MTYVIAEPCVDVLDRACVEECPVDCIYEGGRMLYIHPDECVDCGACEPVCPVEAIFYEDDVPAEWADYTRANVDFFDDLGSPGGASKVGKITRDDPLVSALPPMGEGKLTSPAGDRTPAAGAGGSDRQRTAPVDGAREGGRDKVSPITRLPEFPWDTVLPARARASEHPDGLVDLSIGTPVDRVPMPVRAALGDASDAPGYPTVHGTAAVRRAYSEWLSRAHGVSDLDPEHVLPTMGSKELVASLPTQLGLKPGDVVVVPELAYPTYEVGAIMAGATVARSDSLTALGPERVSLLWINSPSNPTGRVLPVEHLAKIVAWARSRNVIVASDECYIDLGWESTPVSILHPDVCKGDHTRLLAVHSLSKRSNMAGYRAGFVSGDPALVAGLTAVRRHLGAMVPTPVQSAARAALADDGHVLAQRSRYGRRREILRDALDGAGFQVSADAGLYLWCTRNEPAMRSVDWFAERGILVTPGIVYGPGGANYIRVALTASDERIAAAAHRLEQGARRR